MLQYLLDMVANNVDKILLGALGAAAPVLLGVLIWLRQVRNFNTGKLPEEVKVVCNIFEPKGDGTHAHKPRTSESPQPIARAFPNPVMQRKILTAITSCDSNKPGGAFINMKYSADQVRFIKGVRDIASEQGGDGQLARMYGLPVVKKVGYACVTFAPDGDQRKIRIDLISAQDLKKFFDSDFAHSLTNRKDEGSHDDLAAIFAYAAEKEFAKHPEAPFYVIRVSHAFTALGLSPGEIFRLSDE